MFAANTNDKEVFFENITYENQNPLKSIEVSYIPENAFFPIAELPAGMTFRTLNLTVFDNGLKQQFIRWYSISAHGFHMVSQRF